MSGNALTPGGDAQSRIQHLEAELSAVRVQLRQMRGELAAWERRGQDIAAKWRKRNQQLAIELQAAQVGLTSGCGCPIGECQQRGSDQGSCWMLWAEAHVLQRMAGMRIGDLQRASQHPSRYRQAREAGRPAPRLASPEPIEGGSTIIEPGIEDYGSESSSS